VKSFWVGIFQDGIEVMTRQAADFKKDGEYYENIEKLFWISDGDYIIDGVTVSETRTGEPFDQNHFNSIDQNYMQHNATLYKGDTLVFAIGRLKFKWKPH
jgi:hypothetical protein